MKFNITNTIEKATKEFGLESGAYLKIKEGANKLRLLSETVAHESFYKGNRTVKFVCWVYDYADGKVKLYFMPFTILKAIESLQLSEDYAFDEVPMPYDITINAKNAGTKEVDYQVVPARANTEISSDVLAQFAEKATVPEVIAKLKENDAKNPEKQAPQVEHDDEIRAEDIPF